MPARVRAGAAVANSKIESVIDYETVFFLLVSSLITIATAHAGDVKVRVAIAQDGETRPATVFPTTIPKLYAFILTEGTEKGDKARGVWIAEDVGSTAPRNTKIDEATITGDKDNFGEGFSLSKPKNNWPKGKYRVDVYVDDELEGSAKFQIE